MRLNPVSALIAVLAATAASGLFAYGLESVATRFDGLPPATGEDDLPDLSGLVIVAFPMFTLVPNAILVLALGMLGRHHGWARSSLTWVVGGLPCGLILLWLIGPLGGFDPGWVGEAVSRMPAIMTGILCALVARLCIRWTAEPAEAL